MPRRLLPALLVVTSVATLRATTLVPADLNEVAVAADAIVYARVSDVSTLASDDRLRVESVVTAEAIGYVKGNMGRTVRFRVPGGTVGRYRTVMIGAPTFQVGEEVVLFFGARPERTPYLVGFTQGVYRVRVDAETGARMVFPPPPVATGEDVKITRGTRAPMPLDRFAQQVRAMASGAPREDR